MNSHREKTRPTADLILQLTQRWRQRLLVTYSLRSLALGLLLGTVVRVWGFSWTKSLVLSGVVAGGSLLIWFVRKRLAAIKPQLLVAHLNRKIPALEESGELLVREESSLSVLEKMQRDRVAASLQALELEGLLPVKRLRQALAFFGTSLVLTVTAVLAIPHDLFRRADSDGLKSSATSTAQDRDAHPVLSIESVKVLVKPPVYTMKAARSFSGFNVEVEEGATVTWEVHSRTEVEQIALVFNDRDTLALDQADALKYSGQREVWESAIYRVLSERAGSVRSSEYHKLSVTKDQPPMLVVVEPESRTVLEPDRPAEVNLRVIGEDDYGFRQAQIVATVTKGSGEGVKFREQTVSFDKTERKSSQRHELHKRLDLQQLNMSPGDELYFYVEAWDNREPEPNRSRSETLFVILKDTTRVTEISSFGLGINPLPEYFRSQRQIIIDTEKLLEDQSKISASEFKRRSNNLGIDQQALRLRYGQFLGEEAEGFAVAASVDPGHALANPFGERVAGQATNPEQEAAAVPEALVHEHDYEENATLFSQSVKDQLKAALGEMWDAELNLRTIKPREAIPFEYRALVLLKSVQQHARIYVKRIGFEPPPLEPDQKRLSGELDDIRNSRRLRSAQKDDRHKAIRAALQVLRKLGRDNSEPALVSREILETAGQELARHAIAQPGQFLGALQDLRTLILNLEDGQPLCEACLPRLESTLWNLLPPQEPRPDRRPALKSDLSKSYFRKIGESF